MAWLEPIIINSIPGQWQLSSAITKDFIRVVHQTSGLNNSFFTGTLAQCEVDENQRLNLYNLRIIKATADIEIYSVVKPKCLQNQFIAFKPDPYALLAAGQVWNWQLSISQFTEAVTKTFVSNGDTNGIFYYLGTNAGLSAWSNPHSLGAITISMSSIFSSVHNNPSKLVDRQINSDIATADIANSWYSCDLKTYTLKPSAYSIRARDANANNPANWKLQASNDGLAWTDLHSVSSNPLSQNAWYSATVTTALSYRYFRLLQTGLSTSGDNIFCLGEFELYGTLTPL